MQQCLSKSLQYKLSRRLPHHLVHCFPGFGGVVYVQVKALGTEQSWLITDFTIHALSAPGKVDQAVEDILIRIGAESTCVLRQKMADSD